VRGAVMSVVQFRTPGSIPIDAFTIMGVNVKIGDNPIGRFGTGLKYAVATILRAGGIIRLFVEDVEWEFYLSKKEFRGTEFQQVRMRKKNGLGKWVSSRALPFTTQLGRDWKLWQAYRELESNTRDEGGSTHIFETDPIDPDPMTGLEPEPEEITRPKYGTVIEVECSDFAETIEREAVFLDTERLERVFKSPMVDIYDAPSNHLYYRGIRVYTLRYPSLFTYDFGAGQVTLTEDRTMGNVWSCMWNLAHIIQNSVEDSRVLDRILSKTDMASFENYELNFDSSGGGHFFRERARYLGSLARLGLSGERYYNEYQTEEEKEQKTSIELPDWAWEHIIHLLREAQNVGDEKAEDIADEIEKEIGS
jgi:hypothetical protein